MRTVTWHAPIPEHRTPEWSEPASFHSISSNERDAAVRTVALSRKRVAPRTAVEQAAEACGLPQPFEAEEHYPLAADRAKISREADPWDEASQYLSDALACEDDARGTAGAEYDESFDDYAYLDSKSRWQRHAVVCGRIAPDPEVDRNYRDKRESARRFGSAFRIPQATIDRDDGDLPEWAWRPWFNDPRRAMRLGFKRAWDDDANVRAVCLDTIEQLKDEPQPDRFESRVPLSTEYQMPLVRDGYVVALAGLLALQYRVLRGMVEHGPRPRPPENTHFISSPRMRMKHGFDAFNLAPNGYEYRQRTPGLVWPRTFTRGREATRPSPMSKVSIDLDKRQAYDKNGNVLRPWARTFDPDGTSIGPDAAERLPRYAPDWRRSVTRRQVAAIAPRKRRRRRERLARRRRVPIRAFPRGNRRIGTPRERIRARIRLAVLRGELPGRAWSHRPALVKAQPPEPVSQTELARLRRVHQLSKLLD